MPQNSLITLTIALVALTSLVGCASSEYNEALEKSRARALEYASNPDLNKFGEEHLKCFICETGNYPVTVAQIVQHTATTATCKPLFNERPIDFLYPRMASFLITHKEMDNDSTLFVITEKGMTFEQVESNPAAYDFSMISIAHNELEDCKQVD